MSSDPLFLGLDLSTQQLKAILINKDSRVVHQTAVHFDRDLPHHGTTNGAIQGPDEGEVTSPVEMWLEAVDLLFARLQEARVGLGAVMAVSGAGQVCLLGFGCILVLTCFHSNMVLSTGRIWQILFSLLWILKSGL
jgi:sugar (pentulose or hexulose) kinase